MKNSNDEVEWSMEDMRNQARYALIQLLVEF